MKLLVVFAFCVMLIYVSAGILPDVYDGPTYELVTVDEPEYNEESDQAPIRSRRVTCDLLSWQSKWLTINHSACAAKCLAQRRRGGRCRDGICICRK
ncbi:defensin-2 [Linepithema humile]|uniref:defensin-2 n=1 Tax=Linepithema humile TaxID=83485 RepID=UPI0006239FC8|nr:PREDICTED: defensin-2 [Linepithema humile]